MAVDDVRRVFVYGSLLHEPSLMRTLAHRAVAPPSCPYVLPGWERAWHVVSARTFVPVGDPAGRVHRRLVLGLHPADEARCEGLLADLTEADLAALAPREAAYELVEVGDDDAGAVWAFVARIERVVGAAPVAEPLVVEQAYLDDCLAGCAAHGLRAADAELRSALGDLRLAAAAA